MAQPRKLNEYEHRPNEQCVKINIFLLCYDKYEPWNKGNPRQKAQVCGRKGEAQKKNRQKRKAWKFYKICLVQGFKKINKNYLFEEFEDYIIILHAKNKP